MKQIDNLTPFGYGSAFAYDLDDVLVAVLCVAGRFQMPPAGTISDLPLRISDEQVPPTMADEFWSDPTSSSLRSAGQGTPQRPGAEVYVRGSAWAPLGRPVSRLLTSARVGSCYKQAEIVGDRFWTRGLVELAPTDPELFVTIPLRYERSFGGTAWGEDGEILAQEPRNPVGTGVFARQKDALDRALPNIARPGERTDSWNGRFTPWGYGPVPGSWLPRRAYAGTYDNSWIEQRMPLWPADASPQHFCAAAPGLSTDGAFHGGEPVSVQGMSPDGDFAFRLPEYRVVAKAIYGDETILRRMMPLEGVLLEPDIQSVTLLWRVSVPLRHARQMHLHSTVRLLESWEEPPQ